MRRFFPVLLILVLFLPSALLASAESRRAVIFVGETICEGCETPWVQLFQARGFKTEFVKSGESTAERLHGAVVYVVPGGEDVTALSQGWTAGDRKAIRDFVRNGGRYVGSCLGGYWAADWPGTVQGFESLGIAAVHVSAHDSDPSDKIVKVIWRGRERYVYFQDGPEFELLPNATAEIIATFENQKIASLVTPFGFGKVALTSVHVEATEDWFRDAGLADPDGLDLDLANELLDAVLLR